VAPVTATAPTAFYDSDIRPPPIVAEAQHLYAYRGLLKLLIVRDVTVRYKRSVLGLWWTLLNPLLTSAIMYLVFSQIFRFAVPGDVPFVVYLLSGILLMNFFALALNAVGVSLVSSAGIITKVYVPGEVFAVSAALAAGVNFVLSLLPLLVVQLITGVGIPWTVLLIPVPALAMLALVTGLGLLVATAAIRFHDTLDLVAVLVVLLGYLTPTFYPIAIVPRGFRWVVEANPLYSYLTIFRQLMYGAPAAPWWCWVVMLGTAVLAAALGAWTFSRHWRSLAVLL
jgi:ABC-type polysaccharide/polyol phosphate export permease